MCAYVAIPDSVLPGWGCCRCHIYNGLQRPSCKGCGVTPCTLQIPTSVVRCGCGFGLDMLADTLRMSDCPVCGAPFPPQTVPQNLRDPASIEVCASLEVPPHDPAVTPPRHLLEAGLSKVAALAINDLLSKISLAGRGGRFVVTIGFEPKPPA